MACRPGALKLPGDKEKRKDELIVLWLIAAVGILAIMWLPTLAPEPCACSVGAVGHHAAGRHRSWPPS